MLYDSASDSTSPQDDDARLERSITRALTAPVRPRAIFRVVAVAPGFGFSRTVTIGDQRAVEHFGPYGTKRAAHELAQRAASRFRAEHPAAIVGVVDIEPVALPAARGMSAAEDVDDRPAPAGPSCPTCGKGLGLLRYPSQIYCPSGPGEEYSACAIAARKERNRDPARRAHLRAYQRKRYAARIATPEGLELERAKWRKKRGGQHRPRKAGVPVSPGTNPTCEVCGKQTRFHQGFAVRFCPKGPGEKRSTCQTRYSAMLATAKLRHDPELRRARNAQNRAARRADPQKWADRLARTRAGKARRRAALRVEKAAEAERPTGSVLLTASPRAPGHDLLTRIYAAVPANTPPGLRMEIISETAALVLEGLNLTDAITQASKSARKGENQFRYTKPIEDCFWLADETALNWEAAL